MCVCVCVWSPLNEALFDNTFSETGHFFKVVKCIIKCLCVFHPCPYNLMSGFDYYDALLKL